MNRFGPDVPDDGAAAGSHVPSDTIESLLRGRRLPGPDSGFRERVVVAMEEAARDRRLMLAVQVGISSASNPRRRLLPEMVAAIAAALAVSVVPWGHGSRAVVAPRATAAVPAEAAAPPVDEPADVHHALSLLDARRDLFAAVAGADRRRAEF